MYYTDDFEDSDYSGQREITHYPSGAIQSYVTLVEDRFMINGVQIAAQSESRVLFYESGALKEVTLAEDMRFDTPQGRIKLRQGDIVHFQEDGELLMK